MDDTQLDQVTRQIEMERAQIGHEIHDALLPLIFAASAGVSSLAKGISKSSSAQESSSIQRERLDQLSSWLEDALQVGRRLLTKVYPPEMVGTLWSRAAKDTIERLLDSPLAPATITWKLADEVDSTSKPIAFAAYRIVVEAVRNAVKNGQATRVTISGHQGDDGLHVVIEDNGCGFDPTNLPTDRFGVRSMIGRAALVGGTLAIESLQETGTTVVFFVDSSLNPFQE